ncbi:hypothetical protein BC938DRAFT_484023 [Jimgerdemannia flammicorona]|uniref:Attractin/MKLN-like beta-propeller domain-containing protein n=1 Tax=Jimgerdemannia flammicorona TaxID=994334 RepID=A0A433R046_9FUNG|nr:hypothetical protein BC938DRAFT_484023 [Jimgerdemannia flammicorona]
MIKPTTLALPAFLAAMAHLITAFSPPGSIAQSAVLINDMIYVYGGQGDNVSASSNFYTLDVSNSWTTTNPPWTDRTSDAGTVSVPKVFGNIMWPSSAGNSIYIWGGSGGYDATKKPAQSGFAQYNIATRSWSIPYTIANMPQERYFATAARTSSGKVYIWGGWADLYTGNTSRSNGVQTFPDTIVFDTNKLDWNVWNSNITPRFGHTATMLPFVTCCPLVINLSSNGQMVIIGGVLELQPNATYVTGELASMSEFPVFDTNSAVWSLHNAVGSFTPSPRQSHNAVLGRYSFPGCSQNPTTVASTNPSNIVLGLIHPALVISLRLRIRSSIVNVHEPESRADGISIIVCCGSGQRAASDVFVLNTQIWSWTQPAISDTVSSGRIGASAVMVNGQMILFFGRYISGNTSGSLLSDVVVLDTRTTPFRWTTTFEPASTDPLAVVGGVFGIVGILSALLVIVVAIFLVIRKPWRKAINVEIPVASVPTNHDPAPFVKPLPLNPPLNPNNPYLNRLQNPTNQYGYGSQPTPYQSENPYFQGRTQAPPSQFS